MGAFAPLVFTFLPGHLRRQWLPCGVALLRMSPVLWLLQALGIQRILAPAFGKLSSCGYSSHMVWIGCLAFPFQQPFG